ncbi:MAG: aminopeptidase P family protein [bacterium]|nr:aminopeptidase P family protein [bacterium]
MSEAAKRIEALRKKMAEYGMTAYYVPTSDFHESEYVGAHFKGRSYLTGFTGSAGTAVITQEEAGLWTDGRYFVQAAKQLEGSGITLYRMGQEGVPTVDEYLQQTLSKGDTLGFDGRVVNALAGEKMEAALGAKGVSLVYDKDLVGEIWEERPPLSKEAVWILEERYAGCSAKEKIANLREEMKKRQASVHILTTLDDIVWLLNIRGNDVPCNPVVLSYAVVTLDALYLFIQEETLSAEVKAYLEGLSVSIRPYGAIYEFVKQWKKEKVLLEKAKINYAIDKNLDASNEKIDEMNPTALAKAIKNPIEVENIRKAHIKDGVAVTKFIYWLKKNIGKIPMDEISVSDKLESLRREQEGNLGLSFTTISAYADNAAMCHYSASKESNRVLEPRGLYLVDSGGQYYEGTTDITRTIALGEVEAKQKEHFSLVAASMLRLADTKFLHGVSGLNLDYVARELFWRRGLDFNHGTGHGVGYLLNVHERPNQFRWKTTPDRKNVCAFEEGMVTSDEPGLYFEGSHGIRTENLLVCVKDEKTEFGQFMRFEHLTFAPIDLDAIDTDFLEARDIALLNAYHKAVYEKIAPYLDEEERAWLKEATREI